MVALSSILIVILILVTIITGITYAIVSSTRPAFLYGLSPQSGSIDTPTKVGTIDDARNRFLVPAGATLSSYVFCTVNNKTQGLGTNSESPIPLFQIGNTFQFQILPGGVSRPTQTRLRIQTQGTTVQEEFISVEPLPQQKWVQVVIVREGRRYTVFYNGKVVASSRTQYFPVINSSQLVLGDPRLRGLFAFPKIAPTPMRQIEIQEELAETSNTRYEPYVTSFLDTSVSFNLGCPNGLFCFSTSSPPTTNPLQVWKSPYA
jgi:hypothetical protein